MMRAFMVRIKVFGLCRFQASAVLLGVEVFPDPQNPRP